MPSSSNCSRVATAPWAPTIHSNCTVTSCGRLPTTASKLGSLSARRGTLAFCTWYSGSTLLNHSEVAASLSPSPSA
ncbi:hypothetical protein D3C75_988220 [compost metagenome]